MGLQAELDAVHDGILGQFPNEAAMFDADTEELVRRGLADHSLREGDHAPDFELPDQLGRFARSVELRVKGPLVVSFYRGGWCPYCSLELQFLQRRLPEIEALGASLVAISPQIPDESLSTAEKQELTFPVLSDVGNIVARQFGLVFTVSEHLRPLYIELGADLPKYNGIDTYELPLPGTFVIDQLGTICSAFVHADYKRRMDPEEIVAVLRKLKEHAVA